MRSAFVIAVWPAVGFLVSALVPQAAAEYWKLGWGGYGTGAEHAKLERIRWDWIVMCHYGSAGVAQSIRAANEALKYNPDQKYLVRLWPIGGSGRFLDYYFDPAVRATVREAIRAEVDAVLSGIDKPENVLGFTFLEELPGHWAEGTRKREMGVDIEPHGAQIAEEMDLDTFEWNAETKEYVCGIYANTLKNIYGYIKSLTPDRTVFHWQHTGVATIDRGGPVDDPMTDNYLLHKLSDVICPGGADGLFTYANSEQVWETYMGLVRQHSWPFFSQLSHPRGMRIAGWGKCEKLAETRDPLNWGSFLFCSGQCLGRRPGDDPGIPQERDRGGMDAAVHQRIFQNRRRVGVDALLSYLRPRVLVHAPLSELKEKGRAPLTVFVHNPRDIAIWPEYLQDAQAMRGVTVNVDAPAAVQLERAAGGRNTVAPGGYERYDFVLTGGRVDLPLDPPIAIQIECSQSPPAVAKIAEETFIPRFETHRLEYAEGKWVEPGFRLQEAASPHIVIRPLISVIERPSLSIDGEGITYDGEVKLGEQLILSPGGRARVSPVNMIGAMNDALQDEASPTGFTVFEDGYGVAGYAPSLPLESGTEYLLEFEGMATDGANSQMGLRFWGEFEQDYHVDNRHRLWIGLQGRFADGWSKISHVFTLPEGAEGLERIYLYRHHAKGAISYGNFRLTPAGESRDVSSGMRGKMPLLQPARLNHVTYRDAAGEKEAPKVEVTMAVEP